VLKLMVKVNYTLNQSKGLLELHLVPKLRMSGAIPLLPLYAFIVCKGTTLCLTFTLKYELIAINEAQYVLITPVMIVPFVIYINLIPCQSLQFICPS
jgi:hypothetical protein